MEKVVEIVFFVIQQNAVHLRTIVELSKFSRRQIVTVLYWCEGKSVQVESEDDELQLGNGKNMAKCQKLVSLFIAHLRHVKMYLYHPDIIHHP